MAVLYTIHYDNVPNTTGGIMGYTGSSHRDLGAEDPYFAHDGSMTARGKRRMVASHVRHGVDVVRRAEIIWQGPYDDTLVKRELDAISSLHHNDPRYGYNLMPQLVGINIAVKLDWTHDTVTHIDTSSLDSFRYAQFHKRESSRTPDGMCSYRGVRGRHHCGGPWGQADPTRWAKVRSLDGAEQELWKPGRPGNPSSSCRDRKDRCARTGNRHPLTAERSRLARPVYLALSQGSLSRGHRVRTS